MLVASKLIKKLFQIHIKLLVTDYDLTTPYPTYKVINDCRR